MSGLLLYAAACRDRYIERAASARLFYRLLSDRRFPWFRLIGKRGFQKRRTRLHHVGDFPCFGTPRQETFDVAASFLVKFSIDIGHDQTFIGVLLFGAIFTSTDYQLWHEASPAERTIRLRAGTLSTAIARMFLFNIQVDSSHSETPAPKASSKLVPLFFLKTYRSMSGW